MCRSVQVTCMQTLKIAKSWSQCGYSYTHSDARRRTLSVKGSLILLI